MATRKPSPFDNLRVTKQNLRQSIQWFQSQIQLLTRSSYQQKKLMGETSRMTVSPVPGRMYLFKYSAITAEDLKYWDAFPCIFLIDRFTKNGHKYFTGCNLHYLPPDLRLKLLINLYDLANNDRFDATTRLKLTYETLIRLSKSKNLGADFAYKLYREDAMDSRFLEVSSSAWPMTSLLPVEAFQKASKTKVWHDAKQAR